MKNKKSLKKFVSKTSTECTVAGNRQYIVFVIESKGLVNSREYFNTEAAATHYLNFLKANNIKAVLVSDVQKEGW